MDQYREDLEFRRIAIKDKIERSEYLIGQYRDGIDHFRGKIDKLNRLLGHIAECLGEPEPEEPK
jgi:hypothetical protein